MVATTTPCRSCNSSTSVATLSTIQLLQFQTQPLLLQLQEKFSNTSVSVTTMVRDCSSHRKVMKGKWTTKRENSFLPIVAQLIQVNICPLFSKNW
jgi:hypothetical protein